jgi:hypothetical protein
MTAMTDKPSKLEQRILAEIDQLKRQPVPPVDFKPTRVLGAFLAAALSNQSIPKERFAAKLGVDQELVDGLLEGIIPAVEIDDEWLAEIAQAIDTPANTLRVILGRTIEPTRDDSDEVQSV